jgi:hypothetical protein
MWLIPFVFLALASMQLQAADLQHPVGECLECHEPHRDPDCSQCHEIRQTPFVAFDPGSPSFPQPRDVQRVGEIDGLTGASGDYYYGAASYLNAAYLAERVNRMRGGAKLVSTVNRVMESGQWRYTPNIATFGYGMREEDGQYYVFLDIGRNNTCHNAVTSGDIRFSYYEYAPEQDEKFDRNRGARIIGRVDYTRTALKASDWKTELEGLGAGEEFSPQQVNWERVGACSLVVEVVGIIPLG